MYTKCPSCRSEISFEPPANMNDLPDGYKHRIKCPSCGVTIGVKIPKQEAAPLSFTPQNEFATTPDSVIPTATPVEAPAKKKAKADTNKKSGIVRNIFMMLFSALFIAINVIAYLPNVEIPYCTGFASFNGIGVFDQLINNMDAITCFTADTIPEAIFFLLPALLFVFSCICFLVAFIAACGKKYSRAFNLIWSLFIAAIAAVILFAPVIAGIYGVAEYFVNVVINLEDIGASQFGLLIPVAIGLLQLLFSLFFLASMEKKAPKKK